MQLDSIKPKLKPPGAKRLKLEFNGLLSSSGFKFNLCGYTKGGISAEDLEALINEEYDIGAAKAKALGQVGTQI